MKQPRNELDDNPLIVVPSHFELLYYKNSYYDCIVSSSDSCVPNDSGRRKGCRCNNI